MPVGGAWFACCAANEAQTYISLRFVAIVIDVVAHFGGIWIDGAVRIITVVGIFSIAAGEGAPVGKCIGITEPVDVRIAKV